MGHDRVTNTHTFNKHRFSVLQDEKFQKMNGGDGCTKMWLYFKSLNCILKNGKFHVMRIFPQFEKRAKVSHMDLNPVLTQSKQPQIVD